MDYYLWSAVKDKCYADEPQIIDALKDNICEAISKIKRHIIDVKEKFYADKPETINALKDNICEAIGKIKRHTIDNKA